MSRRWPAVWFLGMLGAATANVDNCVKALSLLMVAPNNASLPFMNGVSGSINVAYVYQKGALAFLPNSAQGNYDLCNQAHLYVSNIVSTHYCSMGPSAAGVCVPQQCTAEDLHDRAILMPLMNLGMGASLEVPMNCWIDPYMSANCAFQRQAFEYYTNLYNMVAALGVDSPMGKGRASCSTRPPEADAASYLVIFVLCGLVALALGGAAWIKAHESFVAATKAREVRSVEAEKRRQQLSKVTTVSVKSPGEKGFQEISLADETEDSNTGELQTASTAPNHPYMTVSPCPKWLAAFSFTHNWNEIFTVKSRGGEFAIFDGMKAISAAWVVFYHVILWMTYYLDNPEYVLPPNGLLGKWWAVPFFNYSGTLSVDTFFFISAFLATYMLLTKLDREEAKGVRESVARWGPRLVLHRWLRITPAYAVSMAIHLKIAPLLAYGPMAKGVWAMNTKPCEKVWWAHFLYINDVYPWWNQRTGDTCYGHSWYLANDMQYFLLVPVLVALYRSTNKSYKALGVLSAFACLLTCIIASGTLATIHNWSPNAWDGSAGERYFQEAFSRPWIRCASYMIGILFAFLWYHKKTHYADKKFTKGEANLIWCAAMILLALAQYGPFHGSKDVIACTLPVYGHKCGSDWSQSTRSAIIALLRPTWAVGLGLLSMLCWNNQGGLAQKFLAAPEWMPLSTLSFAVYLVHYTVLTFWIGQRTMRIRIDLFNFINYFLGLAAISTGLALAVVLLVEKPFMKLQRIYLEAPKKAAQLK